VVRDSSGSVIVGARVTITDVATNTPIEVTAAKHWRDQSPN